jgi:diguanylate cyclase (GGDEF)-like protein
MHVQERATFLYELQRHVEQCRRDGSLLGLMLIRLRRINEVNSSFGYETGNQLLISVADRIAGILRQNDIIERVGDHGYALVIPALKNIGHASLAANRVLNMMEEPFEINGNSIRASISIGISLFPEHAQDAESLFRLADMALLSAMETNAGFRICTELPHDKTVSPFIIENELRHALVNDEFILYYQPKISLSTGMVCGAEALSRWNSPSRGFVPPEIFIPVAEQTNLMLPFTLWTLNLATRQFAEFKQSCKDFRVAVNLSATILHDPDVVDLVNRTIKIWGIEPGQLILEVTESAMMIDPKNSIETLKRLHDVGVILSIDDFGTGYSSLAYVKRLPVKELKIDRSFVMNMDKDKGDAMIVRTIIDMAHNFEISVTAEGVESQEILDQLAHLGCDYAQGFHMARPMPAKDMHVWLHDSPWGVQQVAKAATG